MRWEEKRWESCPAVESHVGKASQFLVFGRTLDTGHNRHKDTGKMGILRWQQHWQKARLSFSSLNTSPVTTGGGDGCFANIHDSSKPPHDDKAARSNSTSTWKSSDQCDGWKAYYEFKGKLELYHIFTFTHSFMKTWIAYSLWYYYRCLICVVELAQHSPLWWEESGNILLVDEGQRRTCPLITALTIHRSCLQDVKVPWSECMGSLCPALMKRAGLYDRAPGMLVAVHANLPKGGQFCSCDQFPHHLWQTLAWVPV